MYENDSENNFVQKLVLPRIQVVYLVSNLLNSIHWCVHLLLGYSKSAITLGRASLM